MIVNEISLVIQNKNDINADKKREQNTECRLFLWIQSWLWELIGLATLDADGEAQTSLTLRASASRYESKMIKTSSDKIRPLEEIHYWIRKLDSKPKDNRVIPDPIDKPFLCQQ